MNSAALSEALHGVVARGSIAGCSTLLWRPGQAEQVLHIGMADRERGLPMARDTVFRLASMTKPVTAVAFMMLVEEGLAALDDPITRWAPEFADMKVLRSPLGPLDDTVPAERAITVEDLFTHRAGLSYEFLLGGPIGEAYRTTMGPMIDSPMTPDQWIAALASLPLTAQPGARFVYGHATDLLGLLIERVSGQSTAAFMAERIFEPLGMTDTGFDMRPEWAGRLAAMYQNGEDGAPPTPLPFPPRPDGLTFVSGGQGLYSTLDDYLAFARLFIQGGESGGHRLLRPETLALMTQNRLTDEQRQSGNLGPATFAAHGYGLGLSVLLDENASSVMLGRGRQGAVGWPGAFSCWWTADAAEQAVLIYMVQVISTGILQGKPMTAFDGHRLFQDAVYG